MLYVAYDNNKLGDNTIEIFQNLLGIPHPTEISNFYGDISFEQTPQMVFNFGEPGERMNIVRIEIQSSVDQLPIVNLNVVVDREHAYRIIKAINDYVIFRLRKNPVEEGVFYDSQGVIVDVSDVDNMISPMIKSAVY